MSNIQAIVTILAAALATILVRALPFLLFPEGRQTPNYIKYLGNALPCATIGMLVVYCIKSVDPLTAPHGLPEFLALAAVIFVQLWRRSIILSVVIGTVIYMLLVQQVFI